MSHDFDYGTRPTLVISALLCVRLISLPMAVLAILGIVAAVSSLAAGIPEQPDITLDSVCNEDTASCNVTDKTNQLLNFRCTPKPNTDNTVLWLLGDYQVTDLTEFSGEMSLNVRFDSTPKLDDDIDNTYIDLNMTLGENRNDMVRGTMELFQGFGCSVFSISCISISNNVNINRSPEINIYDRVGPYDYITVADVSDPSWDVMECLAGGKLKISISYQRVCPHNLFNYTLTLSGGSCSREVFGPDDELNTTCEVEKAADLTATMETCQGSKCVTKRTKLTDVRCNRATYDVCTDTLSCNLINNTMGWDCMTENGQVIDTYDDKRVTNGQLSQLNFTSTVTGTDTCKG